MPLLNKQGHSYYGNVLVAGVFGAIVLTFSTKFLKITLGIY